MEIIFANFYSYWSSTANKLKTMFLVPMNYIAYESCWIVFLFMLEKYIKPEERLPWKQFLRASENNWHLQIWCFPYLGSTEMYNFCDFEKPLLRQSIVQTSLFTYVFVLFTNLGHFVIIEEGISFLLDHG